MPERMLFKNREHAESLAPGTRVHIVGEDVFTIKCLDLEYTDFDGYVPYETECGVWVSANYSDDAEHGEFDIAFVEPTKPKVVAHYTVETDGKQFVSKVEAQAHATKLHRRAKLRACFEAAGLTPWKDDTRTDQLAAQIWREE